MSSLTARLPQHTVCITGGQARAVLYLGVQKRHRIAVMSVRLRRSTAKAC